MAESIKGLKRTAYCGDFRAEHEGQEVTVFGWVQRQRDLGQLIFIDLRDRTGIIQLAFDEGTPREAFDKAFAARSEYVLAARGVVRIRTAKNPDIPTGEVEIAVSELRVLGKAETPPFEIVENCATAEATRLKYRYLDLRRPDLQRNLLLRHRIAKAARDYFDAQGFVELETPMLIRSTPEGARDFLVPSRLHPGTFYALPQSPQLYKQLSMVAGFDRYMQLARCFRDEDLRADRQPEFTQIDLEMSFVDVQDVLDIGEGFMKYVYDTVLHVDVPLPLPRLTYNEAMERYGSDKPDIRYGMEIVDLSEAVRGCGFGVFASALEGGGTVRALTAKNAVSVLTRKEVDKLTEFVRGIGAKGLAWVRWTEENIASSFGKFLTEEEMTRLLTAAGAEKGDVVLIVADTVKKHVLTTLGALRVELANKLSIEKKGLGLLWITAFPFFEWDEESAAVRRHAPSLHRAAGRVHPLSRQRAGQGICQGLRFGAGGGRAGLRLHPDYRSGAAGAHVPGAGPVRRGGSREIRVPDRRVPVRRAAPRRHGHRAGPAGDADAGSRDPAGCGGLPQGAEHDRAHDGLPLPGGRGAADGAGASGLRQRGIKAG